jgi:hypothetical protein
MIVIEATNVRDALIQAAYHLVGNHFAEETREGPAMVAVDPVTICYRNPKQHVLLNPVRDANPFFHLMEAMWMLAGRDDSAFLDNYVKDFGKKYASNGIVMDAYGQRWRYGLKYDQLDGIVSILRKDPTTRQAVLQMWGAGRDDLRAYSQKPCNLAVSFRVFDGRLNMTVFNRSNDLIWGCCGANAVHFPILQEYIAGRVGLELGSYWQVTNNLHMYIHQYEMLCKRAETIGWDFLGEIIEPYESTMPLIDDREYFDDELKETMEWLDNMHEGNLEVYEGNTTNRFLSQVVLRMAMAHYLYKNKKMQDSFDIIDTVAAEDWRTAGKAWLERHNGQ